MMQWVQSLALWGSICVVSAGLAGCAQAATATATPWSLLDPTRTPTSTLVPTSTSTPTPQPSATPTSSPTATAYATATVPLTQTAAARPTSPLPPTATPIPLPTPDGVTRTLQVPILMYHYLSVPPEGAGAVRRDLSVTPDDFRAQLQALKDAGYEAISLRQLLLALETGSELPDKPIVLTFDDGYRDNYVNAFHILKDEGMTATFFVVTRMLDDERPSYMTWGMLIEMHLAGMEIGSHSYEHVDLADKSDDYLIYQLLGSREAIEARINEPVRFFCYPAGSYDQRTIEILHSANYWGAVTVNYGVEQSSEAPFELQRIRVRGSYSPETLLRLIEEAYDAPEDGIDQSYGIEEIDP